MRRSPTRRLLFALALRLGWVDPHAMARRIPARLLREWEAFLAVEPLAEARADYNAAHVVQMLYNINRDSKKEPNGRPLQDFVLRWDAEEQAPEDRAKRLDEKMRVQALVARAMAEAAGGGTTPPGRVVEHTYPSLDAVGTDGGKATTEVMKPALTAGEQDALAKARAAMERTE